MYVDSISYVHMRRRTTIEIDEALLERAMDALGCRTMRATIEEALRQAAGLAEATNARVVAAQRAYFARSADAGLDLAVLESDEMWR
jgi:Arc/MetJ family transcription regulator